jgi:hypothetical protein
MSPSEVARALRGRRIGKGKWLCKCPGHDDRKASCSISDMGHGKTRIHCFSGCDQVDVLRAAGLSWKDLRPGDVSPEMRNRLSAGERLEGLQRKYGVMQWLAYCEPEKRRYWEAAMRRVLTELEPLYWEVMPDAERVGRITEFEIGDYRAKRLDWLYRRHDGVHGTTKSTGTSAGEVRKDGIRRGSRELQESRIQAGR